MTDVLLSILLLFFSWSWGESSSHTKFVKHRKKQLKKKVKWFDLKSRGFQLHDEPSFSYIPCWLNKYKSVTRCHKWISLTLYMLDCRNAAEIAAYTDNNCNIHTY